MALTLRQLLEDLPDAEVFGAEVDVTGLHLDSRSVVPGGVFLARRGAAADGHDFIPSALARGASAVIVEDRSRVPGDADVPVAVATLDDSAIARIAARFFGFPTRKLVVHAVTGTNGKTSTVALLAHMLRAIGRRPAAVGTIGNTFEHIDATTSNTTPDGIALHGFAAAALEAGATDLVIEASSHGLALGRLAGLLPDVAGFTNLSRDHLDFHGSMEAYRDAKAMLFGDLARESGEAGKQPVAVVFGEDESAQSMLDALPSGVVRWICSSEAQGAVPTGDHAVVIRSAAPWHVSGTPVTVAVDGEEEQGRSPFQGSWQLANASVALAMVAAVHPDEWPRAFASLATFPGVPGRMESALPPLEEPPVFVDYAHTTDAVRNALATLAGAGAARVAIVLGCGGDRDQGKRPRMAGAALEGASHVILTADNPRGEQVGRILDDMLAGVPEADRHRVQVEPDRTRAIALAMSLDSDAVLIAGKGHERTQTISGRSFAFNDVEEARRASASRARGMGLDETPLLAGWRPERLARSLDGVLVQAGSRLLGPLSTDTRTLREGDVFVALQGEHSDGHAFVSAALEAGASALIVEREVQVGDEAVTVIRVQDGVDAMSRLARGILAEARARSGGLYVIGITGSNGKTTAKELTAGLLPGRALATPGNWNNHLGLPLTVSRLADGHQVAVLEMGANRPDDIAELASIAQPEVMVVTSIGDAHLEGFGGTRDHVRRAKGGFLRTSAPRRVVLPAEEKERFTSMFGELDGVTTFGAEKAADLQFERVDPFGSVTFRHGGESFHCRVPLPGEHNASNAAAALLAVQGLAWNGSADLGLLMERLESAAALPGGRLRREEIAGRVVIDDAYNANPSSMRASLGLLAGMGAPRVAVLGQMREVGERSLELHLEIGAVAALACERLIVVGAGAESKALAEGASSEGTECVVEQVTDVEDAAASLAAVGPGATVMLKASRSCRLERLVPLLREHWRED